MPDPVTAFEWKIPAQSQTGSKGLESKMTPAANWTQLEFFDDAGEKPYLKEYEGRGLLKDKAVLITGGDSGWLHANISWTQRLSNSRYRPLRRHPHGP